MPITKSAKKALRQNIRRRARNLQRARAMKDAIKKTLRTKGDEQKAAVAAAYKAIDKAAKRGIIKKNTAARKKSRLMRALSKTNN